MKIRNIYSDTLRIDSTGIEVRAGQAIEVDDEIGWSLCRGGRLYDTGEAPPFSDAGFQPVGDESWSTWRQLEAKNSRRTTGTWDASLGKIVVRCPFCPSHRWLLRTDHTGLILDWASSVSIESEQPGTRSLHDADTIACGKCKARFGVTLQAL